MTDPPTFTLFGDTSSGPPETYTWMLDGREIHDGGPFTISIAVHDERSDQQELNPRPYMECRYRSTLTVTGDHPGNYQYLASNRAMRQISLSNVIVIEGISIICSVAILDPSTGLGMCGLGIHSQN